MHRCREQHHGNEEDVERVEGFIVVVPEGAKGEDNQERERGERLRDRLVVFTATDGEAETYDATPKEWWVVPRVGVSTLASDGALAHGELNGPSQNVDGSDKPDESANPTMHGR